MPAPKHSIHHQIPLFILSTLSSCAVDKRARISYSLVYSHLPSYRKGSEWQEGSGRRQVEEKQDAANTQKELDALLERCTQIYVLLALLRL